MKRRAGDRRALVCSSHVPRPDRDGGARRLLHLLGFLREAGWTVSFLATDGVGTARDRKLLQSREVTLHDGVTDPVEDILADQPFDLALITSWTNTERYLPFFRTASPGTRIITDAVDMQFRREARRLFQDGAGAPGQLDVAYAYPLIRELNIYAAADGVLTASPRDAALIGDLTGDATLAHCVPDCEPLAAVPPFARRRGVLLLGNFEHSASVRAVEYLCREIVPRIDPSLIASHPLYIVGNSPPPTVTLACRTAPGVRLAGWVPSVEPYFEHVRVSVSPFRDGTGPTRTLLHAMTAGTPTVSTSIGVEGTDLRHGEHVLVADDAERFASSIARLLTDATLWRRLSRQGRARIARTHSPDVARRQLLRAIDGVFAKPVKPAVRLSAALLPENAAAVEYRHRLVPRIREIVAQSVPADATVLVVSKGDAELLKLNGPRAWHFPRRADGVYAGHYPATGADAIAHLESLRALGAGFVLFPATALWWLEHYVELKQHLDTCYRLVVSKDDTCVVYDLEPGAAARGPVSAADPISPVLEVLPQSPHQSDAADDVRLIALYLPQFHPIPENDAWWGEGFTEWRNVARTNPLFPTHYQPHIPADLGFYDLRLPEIREAQADLARHYGIHGFCYYHYWFAGKRLLERPFDEVLASGKPDFPFCLCWANDPWSRRWNGLEDELLQAQTYNREDDRNHIRWLLPALSDPRAITIDRKPVFLVYRARHLPRPEETTAVWRDEIHKAGLPGIYLLAIETSWDLGWDATHVGFDAKVLFQPQFGTLISSVPRVAIPGKPHLQVYDYREAWRVLGDLEPVPYRRYEAVFPGWDNTPRLGHGACVLHDSTPDAYEEQLRRAIARVSGDLPDHRVVFINAWNEWAEGCHLEPDVRHGYANLEATRNALRARPLRAR